MISVGGDGSTVGVVHALAGGGWLESASRAGLEQLRTQVEQDCAHWTDADGNRLLAVVDAGGLAGAASACLEALGSAFDDDEHWVAARVRSGLARVVDELHQWDGGRSDALLRGAGIAAIALTRSGEAWIGWLGRTRAFIWRSGTLAELSGDHGPVPGWLDLRRIEVARGDRFLLCSARVAEVLPLAEIARALAMRSPTAAARRLVRRAGQLGAREGVSVQVAAIATVRRRRRKPQATHVPAALAAVNPQRWVPAADLAGRGRRRFLLLVAATALLVIT